MQDCLPLFIIYLREVAEREREKGERTTFLGQQAGWMQIHWKGKRGVKKEEAKNGWIPLISAQRDSRIPNFFYRASVFWLYKYQPGPLQSLWAFTAGGGRDEGRMLLVSQNTITVTLIGFYPLADWPGQQRASISQTPGGLSEVAQRGPAHVFTLEL